MTDLPASWQTDPTGRHDHRYWDGSRWTEHVADAGVAATDQYEQPAAPSLTSAWATPQAIEPEPTAVVPETTAADPTTVQPEPRLQPEPTPEPVATSWGTAPTEVTPTPDPTLSTGWGSSLPPPDDALGAAAPSGGGSDRRAMRNILIGAVIVIVVLIVAVLAIGGSDDDDSRSAVTARIADSIRADDSGFSRGQAECIAKVIVDDVGLSRVKDVDFDAESPPKGDLGKQLALAYGKGTSQCATRDGSSTGGGSIDVGGATSGTDSAAEQLGALSESDLKRQLSDQYKGMGLSEEKADCLGGKMAEALKKGQDLGDKAFGEFFDYLDECHVSLDELGGSTSP
jgi:hypothetical protein